MNLTPDPLTFAKVCAVGAGIRHAVRDELGGVTGAEKQHALRGALP